MTEADEAIREARRLNKKAAAAALVRKEALEAELLKLSQRSASEEEVALKTAALAEAEADYQGALSELEALDEVRNTFERDALRGQVQALSNPDPFSPSAADRALDNVRNHARNLEAEANLAGPPQPRQTEEERDAVARATLDRLKAERGKATPPEDPNTPKKKRTL